MNQTGTVNNQPQVLPCSVSALVCIVAQGIIRNPSCQQGNLELLALPCYHIDTWTEAEGHPLFTSKADLLPAESLIQNNGYLVARLHFQSVSFQSQNFLGCPQPKIGHVLLQNRDIQI